jgi:nitrogen fixation/metabolism regulation signal transduction histidine kinase
VKEKFKNARFLICAMLLFAVALISERYLAGTAPTEIDASGVEAVLHELEEKLDSTLVSVRDEIKKAESEGAVIVLDRDFESLGRLGLTVLVYKNDTLRFWSDNSASADRTFTGSPLNNRIANLNNGWYEIRILESGNFKYVGLIFLKNKYNLTNKYLRNDCREEFNLPPSVLISMIPLSYSFDIRDKEGKYIFSLVPSSTGENDGNRVNAAGILFFLALFFLLLHILTVINTLVKSDGNTGKIIALISGTVAAWSAMIVLRIPSAIYSLDFFDPVYFSGPAFFRTIGDFIISITCFFALTVYIFKLAEYTNIREKLEKFNFYAVWTIAASVYFAVFGYLYHAAELLVGKSKISFRLTDIISLDILSYSGILIMIILSGTVIYVSMQATKYFDCSVIKDVKKTSAVFIGTAIVLSAVVSLITDFQRGASVLYLILIPGAALLTHYRKAEGVVYRYIFMVFLSAVFSCVLITGTTEKKLSEECVRSAASPGEERDRIAELLLEDVARKLPADGVISDFLRKPDSQIRETKLRDYIQHQFFNGYWSKYSLSISVLELPAGGRFDSSGSDFAKAVGSAAEVNGTGFYFADRPDGSASYLAPLRYTIEGITYYVCITLEQKSVPQELGYPELLVDGNVRQTVSSFDIAKYRHGRKISQSGDFSYDFSDEVFVQAFKTPDDTLGVTAFSDYIHTVYRSGENTTVVSRKKLSFQDMLTQFAYLFIIYILVMLTVVVTRLFVTHNTDYRYQIKTRLIFSVSFILMLSLAFICGGTIYMNIHRFRENNTQSIDEKMKSVYMELQRSCADTTAFSTDWNPNVNSAMDEYLISLSHIFFIDVNLYGEDGLLVASSRPEIFKQGLISSRMNTKALQEFVIQSKSNYIQSEKIGRMSYASAYIPFYNQKDKLTAYINLPYFTKPEVLQKELGTQIVSIVNFYVVLLMIAVVTAVIISERIVEPIKMIQNKFEKIELGKKHEKIEYNRRDELGQLVAEYNNMAEKLEESAKLLAQGERESAWREMAKQIAHEIKNPLTPMKLSIQFLMRSKANNDADFDKKLEKVSGTLIQQIDTLSSIATGFSNFAKMPKPDEHPFNVIETLSNVIQLFNNVDNIDITSDLGDKPEIVIVADKEQISRVFINLIKNATQAIPEGVRGKIHVSLECGEKLVIKISDNGCGIPDEIRGKLFTPSFTTKSSGSGLGLAMVKNIIINAKGDITFESEVGKGTTFIVTLPV